MDKQKNEKFNLPGDISLPKIGQEVCMLRKIGVQEDPEVQKLESGSRCKWSMSIYHPEKLYKPNDSKRKGDFS